MKKQEKQKSTAGTLKPAKEYTGIYAHKMRVNAQGFLYLPSEKDKE